MDLERVKRIAELVENLKVIKLKILTGSSKNKRKRADAPTAEIWFVFTMKNATLAVTKGKERRPKCSLPLEKSLWLHIIYFLLARKLPTSGSQWLQRLFRIRGESACHALCRLCCNVIVQR